MKKYFLLFALLSLLAGLTSCSDDEDENAPPTATELLTANAWVVQEAELDIEGLGAAADTLNLLDNLRQSRLRLQENQSFEVTDRTTGETQRGTWILLNDDTEIQFSGLLSEQVTGPEIILSETQLQDLQTFRITELSATRWTLANENDLTLTLPGIPIPVRLTITIDVVLTPEN